MKLAGPLVLVVFAAVLTVPLPAQQPPPRGRAGGAGVHAHHRRVARWRRHPAEVHAGGAVAGFAGDDVDQRAGRHAQLRAALPRPRRAINKTAERSGALAGLGHSRHRHRVCRERCRRARSCPTAAARSARRARSTGAPARRAAGPKHHYTFEIYALDTTIDVPHGANEQETRTGGVCKRCRGTSSAKPSTPGCSSGRSSRVASLVMTRSPQLTRVLRAWRLAQRLPCPLVAARVTSLTSSRPRPHAASPAAQFIGAGAAAVAAASVPLGAAAPRVAIVGAGLAGLTCADRLQAKGVQAVVYEASSRLGGRCFSNRTLVPGMACENGGELVDTGHKTVLGLRQRVRARARVLREEARRGAVLVLRPRLVRRRGGGRVPRGRGRDAARSACDLRQSDVPRITTPPTSPSTAPIWRRTLRPARWVTR